MDLQLGTTSSASEDGTVVSVTGHGVDNSATGHGIVVSTSVGEGGGLTNGAAITASGCAIGSHSKKSRAV